MTLTVGSLFSGIGGLELGLERAGMKTVWQVECDDYARRVLKKHWPDVWRPFDVEQAHFAGTCERGAWPCSHCLGPADLICGGFPCTDISNAGKMEGLAGEKSGLWSEFFRLICEIRPRFVVVENVSALRRRGLDQVLGDLATGGFDAEWDCVPASAVGAPHQRDRIFIVAHARGAGFEEHGGAGSVWSQQLDVECGSDAEPLLGTAAAADELQRIAERGRAHWGAEPRVDRVADGIPFRVDRLRGLGNAVVPFVSEFIGRRILAREAL